ncbi:TPA: phage head-binding domain-containing protein [Escherichia coli]
MTDITANVIVSMPSQLFTMARSFKAVANGKIYIGKIDTDPVNPENQIQVYVENEDGSHVPVSQPIIINAAGYPVYNGQIAKFVTEQGHSMAVYDAYGSQQFYFPNVLKYDPDQFRAELGEYNGALLVGGCRQNYQTVDEMINDADLTVGERVAWDGYYIAGDGGGNSGIVVAGMHTADGGSIFALNNGLYVKAYFTFIEPAKFGVSETRSSSQNHSSITSMIKYALETNKKIQNYVPMDYKCDPIIITGDTADFFSWEAPRGNVTHRCENDSSPAFILQGSRTNASDMNTFQYCTIKGLRIVSSYCGIYTRWTENLTLSDLLFNGPGYGIVQSANGNLETDIKPRIERIIFSRCKQAYKGAIPDGIGDEGRVSDCVFKDWIALNCGTDNGDWVYEYGYLDGAQIDHVETYTDSSNTIKMNGMRMYKPNYTSIKNCNVFETNGVGVQISSPRNTVMDETNNIVGVGGGENKPALMISSFAAIESFGSSFRPKIRNCYANAVTCVGVDNIDFSGIDESGNLINTPALAGFVFQSSEGCRLYNVRASSLGAAFISVDSSIVEVYNPIYSRYSSQVVRMNNGKIIVKPSGVTKKITSATSLGAFDEEILYDATSGSASLSLPSAAGYPGKTIRVSKIDASDRGIGIFPSTGDTINGSSKSSITAAYETKTYKSDGVSNWVVF